MSASTRKPTRYAHSSGHTDVCYSENGEKLITCGTDGDIRIWSGIDDYDPSQTCVGEWSLCVRQKNKHILLATDSNAVQLLTFPNGERESILCRFTGPVNHIAVNKEHDYIALVVDDLTVNVFTLLDNSYNVSFSTTADGPPLSCALCSKAKILSVSSGDGFIRFWNIETKDLLKEFICLPKVNSFQNAKLFGRMDFDPTGANFVAYPEKNKIIILNTIDWSKVFSLTAETILGQVSIVQYSPCGKFVAGATDKGEITVWEVESQRIVNHSTHPSSTSICSMVWNPQGNGEIAYCDVEGQLGVITECCRKVEEDDVERNELDDKVEEQIQFDGMAEYDDDEDNENVVSLSRLKDEVMGVTQKEASEADDKSNLSSISSRPKTPEYFMQSPFMPSASPEHVNPRYLCWNDIGIVRCYGSADTDESEKSIEVEFHDSSFHNSMMVANFNDNTMGSLSSSALAVANSRQVTVIPLSSGSKEWNLSVEDHVSVTSIATSNKLICFATSNYLVYVCTIYGNQRAIFSTPGPVIAMSSYENSLLIAYHNSLPRKEDQCVQFMLVGLDERLTKVDIGNTLGPECTLEWIGFTDVGNPCVFDSNETLFVFVLNSNLWVPVCDTTIHRKSPSDGFYVTAVFESLQTIRGVRCKGTKYPSFTPRPTLSELILQPPFIDLSSEKSQMESNLFMWSTLNVAGVEKKFKETALKAFALACKNQLDQRAYELVETLNNPQVVSLAVKYASKLDKKRLAEKLLSLASLLTQNETDNGSMSLRGESKSDSAPKSGGRRLTLNLPTRGSLKTHPSRKENDSQASPSTPSGGKGDEAPQFATPLADKCNKDNSLNFDSQVSLFGSESKNPFLNIKKAVNSNANPNPMSLNDKFAGYDFQVDKSGKRKQTDSSASDHQKGKQRKLTFEK